MASATTTLEGAIEQRKTMAAESYGFPPPCCSGSFAALELVAQHKLHGARVGQQPRVIAKAARIGQ